MMEDDMEFHDIPLWGWRGNTTTACVIVVCAIALYFTGWWKPKPAVAIEVRQWQPMKGSLQACHVARFYYDGRMWRCV